MNQGFDVIVVGGGIMGCATALELSRRGVKVAVVEKGSLASGSTGKSSAIVRQHYSNEVTARMARWGLDVFRDFDARVGGTCGFVNAGFLVLVPAAEAEGLRANVALQRAVDVNTRILSPEEIRGVLPGVASSDLVAAAYEPDAGYADPHMTTTALADAAKRLGAKFFFNRAVTGIRFFGGRVVGVDTDAGSMDAPVVVNCAGPWGARVAAMAGLDVPVASCRAQVAVFGRPPEQRGPHPVVLDFAHASYFRPETGNLMLVGLIDPSEADDVVDPDDYPEHSDGGFDMEVGSRWVQRCPAMEAAEHRRGYAGLYAITPDWHPIIDEVPMGSGHFLCTGFSGHGFKLGPAVGLMTAEMVTGEAPTFDRRMFRLSRYAEGDPVRGRYEYSITG
ncbi:MAG TPA: FAD-dependent oxidoreductase [Longimicrobiales bacterium]|nr:FAD-dependent oxidoreductase [Longimicrobiales bacterium]